MIQIMRNGSDISRYVTAISPITYRRNDDGTFELPEISVELNLAGVSVDDVITVRESATNTIDFYAEAINYDYSTQLYTCTCPHILARLKSFYAREITINWADIVPDYTQYNFQTDTAQGQNRWARRYWQVLFLMQTLIRKATGIAVNSVNVAAVTGNSLYYTRAQNELSQWVTTPIPYAALGVSQAALLRLGSRTHLDYASADYDVYGHLPTCLDVLRYLCAACGLHIDIFRADYRISVYTEATAPASSLQLAREDRNLDMYRFIETNAQRLVAGSFDYIYGTYDELDLFVPYTYGSPDAEYTLTRGAHALENGDAEGRRKLTVAWPSMFKLYAINSGLGYQSNIYYIYDAQNEKDWLRQYLDQLTDYWFDRSLARAYTIYMPSLTGGGRMVEYDVGLPSRTKKIEVIS